MARGGIIARNAIQPVPFANRLIYSLTLNFRLTTRAKEARDKRLPVSLVVVALATDLDALTEDMTVDGRWRRVTTISSL